MVEIVAHQHLQQFQSNNSVIKQKKKKKRKKRKKYKEIGHNKKCWINKSLYSKRQTWVV